MISFAQNFEDVILNHAFEHQETGFYVDIGCGDPVIDNVTFNLYRNGWRGLVVDGELSVLSEYSLHRPLDIVRHAWLSAKREKRAWVHSDVVGLSRLATGAQAIQTPSRSSPKECLIFSLREGGPQLTY